MAHKKHKPFYPYEEAEIAEMATSCALRVPKFCLAIREFWRNDFQAVLNKLGDYCEADGKFKGLIKESADAPEDLFGAVQRILNSIPIDKSPEIYSLGVKAVINIIEHRFSGYELSEGVEMEYFKVISVCLSVLGEVELQAKLLNLLDSLWPLDHEGARIKAAKYKHASTLLNQLKILSALSLYIREYKVPIKAELKARCFPLMDPAQYSRMTKEIRSVRALPDPNPQNVFFDGGVYFSSSAGIFSSSNRNVDEIMQEIGELEVRVTEATG